MQIVHNGRLSNMAFHVISKLINFQLKNKLTKSTDSLKENISTFKGK